MVGRKVTKYQRAQKAASNYCKVGTPAAKERRDKAIKAYKDDAIKKGKTSTEVNATASKLIKCDFVGAKKRKTTPAKKRVTKKK